MLKLSLFLFANAWLRRGLLVLLGLCLSWGYYHEIIQGPFYEPFVLSILIGLFSLSLFRSVINSIIVLLSMVLLIVVVAASTQLGAELPFELEAYLETLAHSLNFFSLPYLMFFGGIPVGFGLRTLVLKALSEKKINKSS